MDYIKLKHRGNSYVYVYLCTYIHVYVYMRTFNNLRIQTFYADLGQTLTK